MERLHIAVASGLLFLVLLACKGASESGPQASASATAMAATTAAVASAAPSTAPAASAASTASSVAPAASGAANASDVTRFPDETKIADEKATLAWSSSKIRKKPQGDVVVSLAKGTSVTKLAGHQGFFLVSFADPKDASRQLMGWVYKDAFNAGAESATPLESEPGPGNKCPEGMAFHEDAATGKHCSRICKTNAQCGAWICYSGACISPQGE